MPRDAAFWRVYDSRSPLAAGAGPGCCPVGVAGADALGIADGTLVAVLGGAGVLVLAIEAGAGADAAAGSGCCFGSSQIRVNARTGGSWAMLSIRPDGGEDGVEDAAVDVEGVDASNDRDGLTTPELGKEAEVSVGDEVVRDADGEPPVSSCHDDVNACTGGSFGNADDIVSTTCWPAEATFDSRSDTRCFRPLMSPDVLVEKPIASDSLANSEGHHRGIVRPGR
jgi:hypothetical protein